MTRRKGVLVQGLYRCKESPGLKFMIILISRASSTI
jgi:hypothetical protein